MKKKWDLSVKGKDHQVVIDGESRGDNVIRVDGRVAARPFDADETQRAFFIDGVAYSLRRDDVSDFELVPIGTGPGHISPATPAEARDSGENVFSRSLRAIARLLRSQA